MALKNSKISTDSPKARSRWVALGAACRALGVNETTIRHWGDTGRVRAFRTVGGHRRFAWEDIQGLLEAGAAVSPRPSGDWNQQALQRIRRRIHRSQESLSWFTHFDEESRLKMRLLGRRLVSLATDFVVKRRRRQELLEEARFLGEEEGRELSQRGVTLKEAVQAFLFFRNGILEVAKEEMRTDATTEQAWKAWQDVATLMDEAFLALAETYEKEKSWPVPAQ
jgi:excisionase family DNA binding protein